MGLSGIYRIVHSSSNRTYIGSSKDVKGRLCSHRKLLRKGSHHNPHLQNSWNKYGETAFVFEPLRECSFEGLKSIEQKFIDTFVDHDLPLYNSKSSSNSAVGFRGTMSEETRRKISCANKGRVLSLLTRSRMSACKRGRHVSLETRKRMSDSQKGKPRPPGSGNHMIPSESTREKMSQARKNYYAKLRGVL